MQNLQQLGQEGRVGTSQGFTVLSTGSTSVHIFCLHQIALPVELLDSSSDGVGGGGWRGYQRRPKRLDRCLQGSDEALDKGVQVE